MKGKMGVKYKKLIFTVVIVFICNIIFSIQRSAVVTASYSENNSIVENKNYINAELTSDNNPTLSTNEDTSIEYRINFQDINTKIDDIIFMIDISKNVKEQKSQTEDNTGSRINFIEQLLQCVALKNNNSKCNVGIIGYSDTAYEFKKDNDFFVTNDNIQDLANKVKSKVNDSNYNVNNRNIKPALKIANRYLSEEDKKDVNKKRNQEIIIISSAPCWDINVDNNNLVDSDVNNIRNSGYKIVTIDISNDSNKTTSSTGSNNSDKSRKIMKLHSMLTEIPCKKGYDYIVAQPNEDNYANDLQNVRDTYESLLRRLIEGTNDSDSMCIINDAKLNFSLNDSLFNIGDKADITLDDNTVLQQTIIKNDDGTITISIPNQCINYIKDNENNVFIAKGFKISFKIEPKFVGNNTLFGRNENGELISNLIYDYNIAGEEAKVRQKVDTPSITVSSFDPQIETGVEKIKLVKPYPNPTTANIGDKIDVKYYVPIKPHTSITQNVQSSPISEVLFLLDLSNSNKRILQDDYYKHVIVNKILDNSKYSNNIKIGFVGMEDKPLLLRGQNESEKYKDAGVDLSNTNLVKIDNNNILDILKQRLADVDTIRKNSNLKQANVMDALVEADKIFKNEGDSNTNKAIVLMVHNNFEYYESKIKDFRNRGYKVIIVDASYDKSINSNVAEGNLNNLFDCLGGYNKDSNFISSLSSGGGELVYNSPEYDGDKIDIALSNGMIDRQLKLSNMKFN